MPRIVGIDAPFNLVFAISLRRTGISRPCWYSRAMSRDLELNIFRVIQRRHRLFVKVVVLSLSVAAVFVFLSVAFRWPMFFALIPIALTGPFMVNVATVRCPHCQRPLHRNFLGVVRPLVRCSRCGFPR